MERKVTCPNTACGAVFKVEGKEVGDVVNCPKCGGQCTVLAEFSAEFDLEVVEAPPEPGKSLHHPARQICSNCGAVLGVRAAICPYCNSDVRTGKAVQRQVEVKKRNMAPVLIAAGAAVLVVVLGVVLLLVLKK
jgi:ribosomal protein L40E